MNEEVWQAHARQWALLGAPLKPSPYDVEVVRRVAAEIRRPRVVLLGVTPELAGLPWPEGTRLRAVDRSPAMIAAVWPKQGLPAGAVAEVGAWEDLPADHEADLVVTDGGFVGFSWPDGALGLLERIHGALAPEGRAVARIFVRPEPRQHLEGLAADLWAGRIGGFHAFKLRLLAAVAGDGPLVRLGDVHAAFERLVPVRSKLGAHLGWDPSVIGTIDAYAGSEGAYGLPTPSEVLAIAEPWFRVDVAPAGPYELAELCPTFVLSPR